MCIRWCRFRWVAIRVWVTRMWRASLAAVYFAFNWLIYKLDYARSFRWACFLLILPDQALQSAACLAALPCTARSYIREVGCSYPGLPHNLHAANMQQVSGL